MPKRKPSDLVFDRSALAATQPAKSLEQQFEEELVNLQPVPDEEVPAALPTKTTFRKWPSAS